MSYESEKRKIKQSLESKRNIDKRLLLLKLRYGLLSQLDIEYCARMGDSVCQELCDTKYPFVHMGTNVREITHYLQNMTDEEAMGYTIYTAFMYASNPYFKDEKLIQPTMNMIKKHVKNNISDSSELRERESELYYLAQPSTKLADIYGTLRDTILLLIDYRLTVRANSHRMAELIDRSAFTPDNKYVWQQRYREYLINR